MFLEFKALFISLDPLLLGVDVSEPWVTYNCQISSTYIFGFKFLPHTASPTASGKP